MRWSYRIRGYEARTHTKSAAKIRVFIIIAEFLIGLGVKPRYKMAENNLITRIFIYSAIKIKANNPLLYSTLNPDTSSDSPSAKSNGARFVSARLVINHAMNIGVHIMAVGI